jgi:hypothetical protein
VYDGPDGHNGNANIDYAPSNMPLPNVYRPATDAWRLHIDVIPPNGRRSIPPGCVFEGSSHRSGDELAAAIVRFAIERGATRTHLTDLDDVMLEVLAFKTEWWDGGVGPGVLWMTTTSELASELRQSLIGPLLDQALDYLNDPENPIAPTGYYFTLDDGLYLTTDEDTDTDTEEW